MPAPAFTLREALEADFEVLFAMHRTTMRGYLEQTFGRWDEELERERHWDRWLRLQGGGATRTFSVVEVDGHAAAYLEVERESDFVLLNNIRVAPEYQRRGLGTALIEHVIREAGELPVDLGVLRVNPAQHLYARLGFRVTGESETHLYMRREPSRH
jgi:ribosomal protein S18 acetylase RimI-like enzyme